MRTLNGVMGVRDALGKELGVGSWYTVTQTAVREFADVTGDHQWIHLDTERAAKGPYGGTIAHGYFTLSLLPLLAMDAYAFAGFKMKVNYGLDRVRFPAPVLIGSRIRTRAHLTSVETTRTSARVVVRNTVEIEGKDAPGCVADTVSFLVT